MTTSQKNKAGSNLSVPEIIRRFETSPKYQALPPDKQNEVRGKLFDKYVAPYYKSKGVPYTKEEFISRKFRTLGGPTLTEDITKGAVSANLAAAKVTKSVLGSFDWLADKLNPKVKHNFAGVEQPLIDRANEYLTDHYSNSLRSRAADFVGEQVGQLPAYVGAGRVLSLGTGLLKGLPATEKLIEVGGPKGKFLYDKLRTAADVYLGTELSGGSQQESRTSGITAGIGDAVLSMFGRLLGIGGGKLVKQVIQAGASVGAENVNTEKLSGKLTRAGQKLIENAGGLDKIPKTIEKSKNKIARSNKDIVELEAKAKLAKVSQTPQFQKVATILNKHDKTLVEKHIASHVAEVEEARESASLGEPTLEQLRNSTVGAASSASLDFEENVSKSLKNFPLVRKGLEGITFEDRGHKLLASLALLTQQKSSKARDEIYFKIVQHLQKRYPNKSLPQLVEMGNQALNKIEALRKTGIAEEGQQVRFFRQSELDPSQPLFGHEIDLYAKAGHYETGELKKGVRVRVGATKTTGEILEVGPSFVKIRLRNNKVANVSKDKVFPTDKYNIIDAARAMKENK